MEGTNKTFCTSGLRKEKGAVTTQKTDPDLLVSFQESSVKVWVDSDLLQVQGH